MFECIYCGRKTVQNLNSVRSKPPKHCMECSHHAKTHGMYKTQIYRSWQCMRDRCDNPNATHGDRYRGRGITYIKRWSKFENFYKDMSPTWRKNLTLDRIDNNKNYSKENCKWSSRKEQVRNRSNTVYISHKGKMHTLAEWSEILKIKYGTLYTRFSRKGHI